MGKTQRNTQTAGDEAFQRHYAAIWGEERWQTSLYPALMQSTRYACLANAYCSQDDIEQRIQDLQCENVPLNLPQFANKADQTPVVRCFVRGQEQQADPAEDTSDNRSEVPFIPPELSSNGLLSHWNLDGASVLVAHLLNVQPGDKVLDFCAAPGGKSMVLAQHIWPHLHHSHSSLKQNAASNKALQNGHLRSNELDRPRHRRLAENLKSYLPSTLFQTNQVQALRIDGTRSGIENDLRIRTPAGTVAFDRVLVDAPCSSERHIIHANVKARAAGKGTADEMSNWRPGSSKRLAAVQKDLLMTALRVVKLGGVVMYATCSIDPTENDGVVEKALAQVEKDRKKGIIKWKVVTGFAEVYGDAAIETQIEKGWAERTKHGWIALPDHPSGGRWGPLFFTVFKKVAG